MALPVTITNARRANGGGHYGPFLNGTNAYLVSIHAATTGRVDVYKATDPTSSFSSAANFTAGTGNAVRCVSAIQSGTDIHIFVGRLNGALYDTYYARFSMSSDTLTQSVIAIATSLPTAVAFDIVRASDGDLYVFANGAIQKDMGTSYNQIYYWKSTTSGSSWDSAVQVGASLAADHYAQCAVLGASDRCHFIYTITASNSTWHRALNSSDVLQTQGDTTSDWSQSSDVSYPCAVSVTRSSTNKIRVLGNPLSLDTSFIGFDSGDAPSFTKGTINAADGYQLGGVWHSVAAAVDGEEVYAIWVLASDQAIYYEHDGGTDTWTGSPVAAVAGITADWVSANIYTRGGGKKLALLYTTSANSDLVYNEVTLTAPAFTPAQTAYQFADDGTESSATLLGSLSTALSRDVTSNSNLQLRVRIQEGGGAAGAATDDYQLQRSINGGAFADVNTTSTGVKVNTGSALTDGGATTNRLGAGTGSFVAGEQEEANGLVEDSQLTASNFTEHVWALTAVAAELAAADQVTFRVLVNGAVMTYTVTPTLNVTKLTPSFVFPPMRPSMMSLLVR